MKENTSLMGSHRNLGPIKLLLSITRPIGGLNVQDILLVPQCNLCVLLLGAMKLYQTVLSSTLTTTNLPANLP